MNCDDLTPENMLLELESNFLEVVLIPAPDQRHSTHCVRAVQYQNAFWYRKFCKGFLSGRKDQNKKGRTLITRRGTIRALQSLIRENERHGSHVVHFRATTYQSRILEFIECEKKNLEQKEKYRTAAADAAMPDDWIPF